MDPIHIDFTIPDQSLYIGFGLLVFSITLYLAISKNWEWVKTRANPLPWMAEHYVALLLPLGFLAISLAIYFWIWDIRGEIGRLVALLSGEATPEDIRNLAYAIAALLGAVALAATIPFQLIKVWVNERLAKTTEQGHMTDRITKAVEQLGAEKIRKKQMQFEGQLVYIKGSDGEPDYSQPMIVEETVPNIEVRLGAIYALERIAQDSKRDHASIIAILCAYIRLNAPSSDGYFPPVFQPRIDSYQKTATIIHLQREMESARKWEFNEEIRQSIVFLPLPRLDIQAALNAISHRKFSNPKQSNHIAFILDLSNCNLQKANLIGNFSGADFSNSLLDGATVRGDFRDCKISNVSHLHWKAGGAEMATFQQIQNPPPNF